MQKYVALVTMTLTIYSVFSYNGGKNTLVIVQNATLFCMLLLVDKIKHSNGYCRENENHVM